MIRETMRRVAIAAACVLLCACAQSAFAGEYRSFSPVNGVIAEKSVTPGDPSGWFIQQDGLFEVDQVLVLADSIGSLWSCFHRVSVVIVQRGVGYTRGWGDWSPPVYPLVLDIYQPPLIAPAGYIVLGALGPVATIGVNEPATPNWIRAAAFSGESCAGPVAAPPAPAIDPNVLARFCREHPNVAACRG